MAKLTAIQTGRDISLKAGAKIIVEAGAELTLKAGGSFVKVDAGGVHLVSSAINLNAGGSAGSGSAYGGQLAAAPRMLAQAKPVAELVQPDIAASMQSGAARVTDVASLPTMMPSSANNTANDEPVAEEKTPERILKSDLLKPSDELEKLAKRQASAYRQGNHSDEVKLLQEALIKLGFDLGKAGADGDFGSKTKTAIEQFQKSYQPSHQTHPSYSIGAVDGIVGKGTLLALDEALMDGWVDSKRSLVFSSNGMALLREIEELRLIPYDDQTGKSISSYVEGATIGYGYLIPKNEWSIYKNGITKEIAEELFLRKVPRFQENVQSKIKVDINQNQFDALVLLCYNIGEGNFNSSSVLKLVNGGSAPVYGNNIDNAWLAWNKSQGKVMQGLIKRRKCELNVYHKGVYEKW